MLIRSTQHHAKFQCTSSNRAWGTKMVLKKRLGKDNGFQTNVKCPTEFVSFRCRYRSYPRVLKNHYETPCEKSLTTCSGVRHFNFPGAAAATTNSSFSNGNSLVNKTWIRRIYCFNNKINVKSKISKAIIKSHSNNL